MASRSGAVSAMALSAPASRSVRMVMVVIVFPESAKPAAVMDSGIGPALGHAGQFGAAAATVKKGLKLDPKHPQLALAAARLERRFDRFTTARKRLSSILKDELDGPLEAVVQNELAQTLNASADYTKAAEAFERANHLTRRQIRGQFTRTAARQELSNAIGPNTSAFKPSSFALLVSSFASRELGILSKTSSVADSTDTFGFPIPILLAKSIAFFNICILVSNFGNTFNAPSVMINGLSFFSKVICQI